MTRGAYIAVAGNIGAGKSSFVDLVCRTFDVVPLHEPFEENPFLPDFYEDMPRWAFHSQVRFLASKVHMQQDLARESRAVIQDRTIWEDEGIFATRLARAGHLDRREWDTYRALFDALSPSLRPPDLLLYLRCPVRTLVQRIHARGRLMEKEIPVDYLRALHRLYEGWYRRWTRSPRMVLPMDRIDPVEDLVDRAWVVRALEPWLGAPRRV